MNKDKPSNTKPGGDTGGLVGSYQGLVKTAESLLHSFSALLQFFEQLDILLLLLAGFLALRNIDYKNY